MSEYLLEYHPVNPTTWAYLSSLLMIGLFFKFGRFWSVRNLDLVLLILFAPGLLLVHYGQDEQKYSVAPTAAAGLAAPMAAGESSAPTAAATGDTPPAGARPGRLEPAAAAGPPVAGPHPSAEGETAPGAPSPSRLEHGRSIELAGFLWLLAVCGLFLVRLLLDPTMVRRPLLEPNLSTGGLTFIGCSLFVFLMANVITSQPTADDLAGPKSAEVLLSGNAPADDQGVLRRHGPGNALLHVIPRLAAMPAFRNGVNESKQFAYIRTAKTMAFLSHLAVVVGVIAIGYRHFDNVKMGIGAATLYLMLPYTALMTGRVDHVLPAALLVWAVLCYRRPLPAGLFMGLAIGVVYYPLFLLPLWISFYWQRGLVRFTTGVVLMLIIIVCSLFFVPNGHGDVWADFWTRLQGMFGLWTPRMEGLQGVWGLGWESYYRIPVLTAFLVLTVTLAVWPAQKNLGTLLSCSAAVMTATQFWHGFGGGTYMAWYLPLILLTIFRPNLEDRVALTVLGEGWFPRRRRTQAAAVEQAA